MGVLNVGVLGAGIVGLTTALELQKQFPTANLTLVADKFNRDTTSDGAAGIFRPGSGFNGPSDEITRQWIKDAYDYYDELYHSDQSSLAGINQLSGYIFSSTNEDIVRNTFLEPLVPLYRDATVEELQLCRGDWKFGSFFTTFVTECRKFQPWALERFVRNGGHVIKKTVVSFNELTGPFDILVNCLGFGAREVCSDHKLVPIRGQIIKVNAPWIKTFFYADYDTYIIPNSTEITLGGCRHYDSYDASVSPHDSAAIKERCYKLLPSLKKAPIIREWAGLRPYRNTVRVESQILDAGVHKLKVVHNYGHGGYGVTTAPGTSKYATKLVKELHSTGTKNSKL